MVFCVYHYIEGGIIKRIPFEGLWWEVLDEICRVVDVLNPGHGDWIPSSLLWCNDAYFLSKHVQNSNKPTLDVNFMSCLALTFWDLFPTNLANIPISIVKKPQNTYIKNYCYLENFYCIDEMTGIFWSKIILPYNNIRYVLIHSLYLL